MPIQQLLDYPTLRISALFSAALLLGSATVSAFTGSGECRGCHQSEHDLWQGSHHDLAMQLPTSDSVIGDFNNTSFIYNGVTTRFFQRGDSFIVNTDGEDGKSHDFKVAYVFGVYPLQQYLLPLSRGRLQALSIAWDARPNEQGGQRWYHLYPEEAVDYQDPLHWTGPYQNWNTRCAECHSTDLKKNYRAEDRSFSTTFAEINVGCEACHGPGGKHLQLAKTNALADAVNGGFPTALAQRGEWIFKEGKAIAGRKEPLASHAQIDNCGRCHARRGTLGDYHYGADLLDTHRLSLPQWPLYFPDGQIRDEDYVYGSFVQSKMHVAGVVCSNCHEPHSLKLRSPGNTVCAQCHNPSRYDSKQHHHHEAGLSGSQCANCHMPETTYMGVDPRRDHSMRIPRPDLSVVIGTPNACNQCHQDKDANWSLQATRDWGIQFRDTNSHPGRAFAQFADGDYRGLPTIIALANNSDAAPIWRATAVEALAQVGGHEALQTATTVLYDDDPLLRVSAIRGLEFLPIHQRFQLLMPLVEDEITSVRMEVATALAAVPLDQIDPQQSQKLRILFDEYLTIQQQHTDMPGVQLQLGIFYLNRGQEKEAEAAYREALFLNPQLLPAYFNLADVMRAQGREDEARKQLLKALAVAPEHGATLHALGLLETRNGKPDVALDYLKRAADLETAGTRHRFVYAIAMHDLGQPAAAVSRLQALLRSAPRDQSVLLALANYSAELGQKDKAAGYARTLIEIAPSNNNYRQLYKNLLQSGL